MCGAAANVIYALRHRGSFTPLIGATGAVSGLMGAATRLIYSRGVLGPVLVNYINDYQIKQGVPKSAAYDTTMYILAALLVGGFLCNLLVRPVAQKWFMTDAELEVERKIAHDATAKNAVVGDAAAVTGQGEHRSLVVAAWLLVGIPLAYGIWNTLTKAWVLFN